jgi:hypothetical protein
MKELPEEKELLELLAMAQAAEAKAKKLYDMATLMALKCELRAEKRLYTRQMRENSDRRI